MKIILDGEGRRLGSDIFSLGRLLALLERLSPGEYYTLDTHHQATLNQWIEYLTNICNQILLDSLEGQPTTRKFKLPFEKEFLQFLSEAEASAG